METLKALMTRKSERDFSSKQLTEEQLATILKAAYTAPVGFGEVENVHLTVVQDPEILERMKDSGKYVYQDPITDIYYGAPTVIIVSTREGLIPEVQPSNASSIIMCMMLAATDMGVDNCYVWGTVRSFRSEPEFYDLLEIPDGFTAMGSISLGFSNNPNHEEGTLKPFVTNRI